MSHPLLIAIPNIYLSQGLVTMNKWRVKPEHWEYLTQRQQKRVFKTGVRFAGSFMAVLIVFSLVIEAVFGL